MTPVFRYTLLWIAGSMLIVIAALTLLSSAHSNGEYVPASGDAFYHARRILDSLFTGEPVIQFDPRIHVPEGSWLTWPWGFDTLLTQITRLFGPYASEADANRVLMNIPPAAGPIAVGIVVILARQLALPFFLAALLVLGFSALPLAYMSFGVGNIDHHFAELLWTLGALSAGLSFFRAGRVSYRAAIVLGCVLGSALAIHNGLFILQIPIAAAFGYFWLRGTPLPDRRQVIAFAVALLATTLLVCIPSEPWRRGFFEFYTLSWFHFHIAACVAVFSVLLTFIKPTPRNRVLVLLGAILALLPIIGTLKLAADFVSGQLEAIQTVVEAKSPYRLHAEYGEAMSTRLISGWLWLTAPMIFLNLWWAWRRKDTALQFLAIANAMGLALMQTQYRFSVFGMAPMLLTPVLAACALYEWRPELRRKAMIACGVLFAVAMYPTLANWQLRWALGGDKAYVIVRSVFPKLKELCAQRPGIVLGDLDLGHWVRYHSQCSVIADVFLLTPQHAAKAIDSARLMQLTPSELLTAKYEVRYVFVRQNVELSWNDKLGELPNLELQRMQLAPLERELLGPESQLPPQFKLRSEVRTPVGGQLYGRLYEIERTP